MTSSPTPYRDPLWHRWSQHPEVDLQVHYLVQGSPERSWQPDWDLPPHEFLPGRVWRTNEDSPRELKWNPSLWRVLSERRPDLVIVGSWGQPTSWVAMTWCRLHGVPYAIQCESHLLNPRPLWVRAAKRLYVPLAVKGQCAGLPTGSLAAECMAHYGADPERLFLFPNSPDAEAMARHAEGLRGARDALRRERGFQEREVILFVGRLIGAKAVDVLMRAFAKLHASRALLWVVGKGDEEEELRGLAADLGILDAVRFEGFVEPADLPACYVAADLFCLPSRFEPWGAVVNEAMACGLPCVLSDRVGAAHDLLSPSCGRMVPHDSSDALAAALDEVLALSEEDRRRWGEQAVDRALAWSHPRCLASLEAVRRLAAGD